MNALLWVFLRMCLGCCIVSFFILCFTKSLLSHIGWLHNLHQSWSPCDKPTYVSEMQDLQVDRSLIYAGDKGCWSMIMIVCLCQWFQCHSLCNWQSTWQSLQTYQAKTTNACVYSYELKGWICHGFLCCISSLLKILKPNWGQNFHFVFFVCQYIFQHLIGQRLKYGSALLTEFDFRNDVSENPGFICPRVKSF